MANQSGDGASKGPAAAATSSFAPPPAVAGAGVAEGEEVWPVENRRTGDLGFVVAIAGGRASARLYRANDFANSRHASIGRLIGIRLDLSLAVGVVESVAVSKPEDVLAAAGIVVIKIDLLGEIKEDSSGRRFFQRGMTLYPAIGDKLTVLGRDELSMIHQVSGGETISIGNLYLDGTIPATINFDELLTKHFAVLGSTGVGKSTGVALILQSILKKPVNLRVLLIDPHSEYGNCFGDKANVVSQDNFRLPFWLFNFEEIVDVFFRSRPGVEEETEILGDLIAVAKDQFAAHAGGAGSGAAIHLRRAPTGGHTADTPVPYRISDLVGLLNDRMGKLENKSSALKYHRLINRIETLGHDSRYAFMFSTVLIEDIMVDVLSELLRLPPEGKPITVIQLAGLPSEVIDSVVSVLCRMAFEYGVWSEGASPCLVCCEEAHRYAPADRSLGFGPTRKAVSRIAKEGRKYGVFLGAITQRPADLDATILSQCSTVFAMRLANERDQAIVKAAVPDAGSSLVDLLPSLGTREAVAFGEGVALPMRFRFAEVPKELRPRGRAARPTSLDATSAVDPAFIRQVVEQWRESTVGNPRTLSSTPDEVAARTASLEAAFVRGRPADQRAPTKEHP